MAVVFHCFTMQSVLWPNAPIIGGWAVLFTSWKYIFYFHLLLIWRELSSNWQRFIRFDLFSSIFFFFVHVYIISSPLDMARTFIKLTKVPDRDEFHQNTEDPIIGFWSKNWRNSMFLETFNWKFFQEMPFFRMLIFLKLQSWSLTVVSLMQSLNRSVFASRL